MSTGKRKRDQTNPGVTRRGRPPNLDAMAAVPCDGYLPFKKTTWEPQRKSHGLVWPRLKKIYTLDHLDELPPSVPTHASISAPPSTIPAKKYCDITGFEAPYTQPVTGLRYADAVVYDWIVTNLDTFEKQQEVLEYRGASTIIK